MELQEADNEMTFTLSKDHLITAASQIAAEQIGKGLVDRKASSIRSNGPGPEMNDGINPIVTLVVRYPHPAFDAMSIEAQPDTFKRFQICFELGSVSVCDLGVVREPAAAAL
jgi:hypothetical protein